MVYFGSYPLAMLLALSWLWLCVRGDFLNNPYILPFFFLLANIFRGWSSSALALLFRSSSLDDRYLPCPRSGVVYGWGSSLRSSAVSKWVSPEQEDVGETGSALDEVVRCCLLQFASLFELKVVLSSLDCLLMLTGCWPKTSPRWRPLLIAVSLHIIGTSEARVCCSCSQRSWVSCRNWPTSSLIWWQASLICSTSSSASFLPSLLPSLWTIVVICISSSISFSDPLRLYIFFFISVIAWIM